MAFYSGEQHGLPTLTGIEPNWHGRWEFTLDKVNATTYNYSFKAFISLSPGKKSKCDYSDPNDYRTPWLDLQITELGIHNNSKGPYGPIIGGNGWYQFRDTFTGSFTVQGSMVIDVKIGLFTGLGSSMGTGLKAIDTWYFSAGQYAVQGIVSPDAYNLRCTGKTSSSLSMAFDVDWGGDEGTRDPGCILYDSAGNRITEIKNGTTAATFTGLSRYTAYYIEGYAGNSVGSDWTGRQLVYTDPENPTLNAPTVSNSKVSQGIQGVASIDVTPGVVTDNGGKAITQVETYIRGGQYGSTLTSIGTGTAKKTVNNLLPNTEYYVITRATNGITESYSAYTTFTTLGNPPEFTDIYASSLALTSANINYTAKYEYNARYKEYQVEWRYPGTSTWTKLVKSTNKINGTNFDDKDDNRIEYRVTVTDNWNRSTTSNVLSYRVMFDYSNDITNFKAIRNPDDTFTITGNWTKRLYTKIDVCLILGSQMQRTYEIPGNFSDLSLNQSGFSFKTKPYKNKNFPIPTIFDIYINTKHGNVIHKALSTDITKYSNAINTINKSGNVVSRPMSSITKRSDGITEIKLLRQHDIVKLSRFMRYIDIDSRGTESNIIVSTSKTINQGTLSIDVSYQIQHVSKNLYTFNFTRLRLKNTNNLRIRNNNLCLFINSNKNINYRFKICIPNINLAANTWTEIDCSEGGSLIVQPDTTPTTITGDITLDWKPEFDLQSTLGTTSNFSESKNFGNSDIANNHLVNIKVYDINGVDRASGKTITLTNGALPIVYNGGNATNGTTDSNKFIYSENGLPLRLDLGQEYEISKIEIQRRILTNNSYIRNYIIGRNENKELCYIFYDSESNNQYNEYHRTFNIK